jgi:hypothetical protein
MIAWGMQMTQEAPGREIRLRTRIIDNSGWLDHVWVVAIDNDQGAIEAVRVAGMATFDEHIEILRVVSPGSMRELGLAQGEAKPTERL